MKKTTKTIIMVLVMVIAFVLLGTIPSMASEDTVDLGNLVGGLTGTKSDAQDDITNMGNQIIGILTTIGVVVAVVVLLVLGIKYMMGSASEKAEYKKTMIPYLVGALLIFGASAITKVVVNMASGFNT